MDDGAARSPTTPRIHDYEELLADAEPVEFRRRRREPGRRDVLHERHDRQPEGRRLLPPLDRAALDGRHAAPTRSASASPTRSCRSCRCSTPTPGAWPSGRDGRRLARVPRPGPLRRRRSPNLIESERVTLAAGVPTIWMGVLAELDGRDLSALRRSSAAARPCRGRCRRRYREQIGMPILQAWGMTETSPLASVCRITSHARATPSRRRAGRPARHAGHRRPAVEIRIVDPERRRGAAVGRRGARRAAGARARGSPPATTATSARRRSSPRTAGCRPATSPPSTPDGYIRLVDRTKDLVKSGGEWISSVELENEIMAHPKVRRPP